MSLQEIPVLHRNGVTEIIYARPYNGPLKRFMNYYVTPEGELFHHETGEKKYTWLSKGRSALYERVQFWVDGKQKNYYVHRLVAMLYLPGWDEEFDVNHIDGNSLNNHVDNLELGSHSYNVYESYWKREQVMKLGGRPTKVIMRVGTVHAIQNNKSNEI